MQLARAQVEQAKANLRLAELQLSYATITAPIAGVVASVSTQEGEVVAAGCSAPTFITIVNLDQVQVDAYVDETDIGKVKAGQEAAFTVDAYSGRDFRGRVLAISGAEDPDSQLFIPITTAVRRLFNVTYISGISVRAKDERSIKPAIDQIVSTLRERHRIKSGRPDDFTFFNQKEILDTEREASQTFTAVLD